MFFLASEYVIMRFRAACVFLVENSTKIALSLLKERGFFLSETIVFENRSFPFKRKAYFRSYVNK